MQLTLNRPGDHLFVRTVSATAVTVIDRVLEHSVVLTAEQALEAWPVRAVEDLDEETIAPIIALRPEVVILGTGAAIHFPAQKILATFLQRGIGLEVMDNAAAARTFNVLVDEGRRAAVAFILPG